jgi:hypothetical protein
MIYHKGIHSESWKQKQRKAVQRIQELAKKQHELEAELVETETQLGNANLEKNALKHSYVLLEEVNYKNISSLIEHKQKLRGLKEGKVSDMEMRYGLSKESDEVWKHVS